MMITFGANRTEYFHKAEEHYCGRQVKAAAVNRLVKFVSGPLGKQVQCVEKDYIMGDHKETKLLRKAALQAVTRLEKCTSGHGNDLN